MCVVVSNIKIHLRIVTASFALILTFSFVFHLPPALSASLRKHHHLDTKIHVDAHIRQTNTSIFLALGLENYYKLKHLVFNLCHISGIKKYNNCV